MYLNRLRHTTALVALALLLVPDLPASNRKGDKYYKEGAKDEAQHDYDKAVELYSKALQADPNDPGYQLAERRARFESAEIHVKDGKRLRDQQKLEEALV